MRRAVSVILFRMDIDDTPVPVKDTKRNLINANRLRACEKNSVNMDLL